MTLVNKVYPKYVAFSLKPSIKYINNFTTLVKTIFQKEMQKNNKPFSISKKGIFYTPNYPYIHIKLVEYNSVRYLFIVPEDKAQAMLKQMRDLFEDSEVYQIDQEQTRTILDMIDNAKYKKNIGTHYKDFFSINYQKNVNDSEEKSIDKDFYEAKQYLKQEGDFYALCLSFKKIHSKEWENYCNKYRRRKVAYQRDRLVEDVFKDSLDSAGIYAYIGEFMRSFVQENFGSKKNENSNDSMEKMLINDNFNSFSNETRQKIHKTVFKTNITAAINCDDDKTARSIETSIYNSLSNSSGDNYFDISKESNESLINKSITCKNKAQSILSIEELVYLLQTANKRHAIELKLPYVGTTQVNLPEEYYNPENKLYQGKTRYRGEVNKVFLVEDKDTTGLAYITVCPVGHGKTSTVIQDILFHAKIRRSAIFIEIEEYKQVLNELKRSFKSMNFKNYKYIKLFGGNDDYSFCSSEKKYYSNATMSYELCNQLRKEFDSLKSIILTSLGNELTPSEEDYFRSAFCITKLVEPDASLKDIIDVIKNAADRKRVLDKSEEDKYKIYFGGKSNFSSEKKTLIELFVERNGKLENKNVNIENIKFLHNKFISLSFSELYENKSLKSLNFEEHIKNGTILLFDFSDLSAEEKGILSCYVYVKLFEAIDNMKESNCRPCSVFIDELANLKEVSRLLKSKLILFRKRQLRFYLTFHNKQAIIDTGIYDDLINKTNTMIRLLNGCQEEEFSIIPKKNNSNDFSYLDIMEMNSNMNKHTRYGFFYVHSNGGTKTHSFIAELPKDMRLIDNVNEYINELYDTDIIVEPEAYMVSGDENKINNERLIYKEAALDKN